MDIQDVRKMKFFFWNDTLQREYHVIQSRLENGNEATSKSDMERMSNLMYRYGAEFKEELSKVTNFLKTFISDDSVSIQEHIDIDIEEYKYTSILKTNGHQFVVKGYTGLNKEAFVSIIIDATERKFKDVNSLTTALQKLTEKMSKKASVKIAANFDQAVKEFIDFARDVLKNHYEKLDNEGSKPGGKWFYYLEPQNGSKYVKLISGSNIFPPDSKLQPKDFSQRIVWAFIDKTNGDILKPASFNAPAKHARGNIFDKNTWKSITPYGPAYLR